MSPTGYYYPILLPVPPVDQLKALKNTREAGIEPARLILKTKILPLNYSPLVVAMPINGLEPLEFNV
jgi:hypothetical protein